jgi:hypothetical protein
MSTATSSVGPVSGATGSGKASVLWSAPASLDVGEQQILVRVDRGGIHIGEGELRYQLERKDAHPLARADELLDVLADLEARGLLQAELCFRLTARGREQLVVEPKGPVRSFAVMEDDSVLCADCVHEYAASWRRIVRRRSCTPGSNPDQACAVAGAATRCTSTTNGGPAHDRCGA